MVRVELPYIQEIRKAGGRKGDRVLRYYRRAGRQWGSLPGEPCSPEFMEAYQRLHALAERELAGEKATAQAAEGPAPGTFARLAWLYRQAPEFTELAPKTQKDYGKILDRLVSGDGKDGVLKKGFGDLRVAGLNKPRDPEQPWKGREFVRGLRDGLADRPHMANYVVTVLRLVLNHGIEIGMLQDNPAARPRRLKTVPRDQIWTEQDRLAWLAALPLAIDNETLRSQLRLAFFLLVYTCQRLGDVRRMQWGHYKEVTAHTKAGPRNVWVIACRQAKTGKLVWVPVHPALRGELDAAPRRGLMMLLTVEGQPFQERYLAHLWDQVSAAAGVQDRHRHDLRRTGMVHMAEGGATPQQVAAVSGHTIEKTTQILETYIPRNFLMAVEAMDLTTLTIESGKKDAG